MKDYVFDPFVKGVRGEFLDCSIRSGNVPFNMDGTWFHWKPAYYYSNHDQTFACRQDVGNFDSQIATGTGRAEQELISCVVQRNMKDSDLCSCDQLQWSKLERLRRGPQFVVSLFSNDQSSIQDMGFHPTSLCQSNDVVGKFCRQNSDCAGGDCKAVNPDQKHIAENNLYGCFFETPDALQPMQNQYHACAPSGPVCPCLCLSDGLRGGPV
eukprot:752452-Hanusia_phi.AAC.2